MTTRKQTLARRRKRRNEDRAERNKTARMATAQEGRRENVRHISQLAFLLGRGVSSGRSLKWKGGISPRQYQAGDRLYRDWRASGSEPQIVPRYDREIGLPPSASLEAQMDARRRYDLALRAAGTSLHRAVLVHICCVQDKLANWSLPPSHGLEVLREALDRLGDWYESERHDELREVA